MTQLTTVELSEEPFRTGVQSSFLLCVVVGQYSAVTDFDTDQLEDRTIVSIDIQQSIVVGARLVTIVRVLVYHAEEVALSAPHPTHLRLHPIYHSD